MATIHPYPHTYRVSAGAQSEGHVALTSAQLPTLQSAPPPEFAGPGGMWSPETLLCASLADCFILTFRALARIGRFEWSKLDCRVEGVLERVGQQPQFTRFSTFARLEVAANADIAKARSLLERAEHTCLIANSLKAERTLHTEVEVQSTV